MLTVIPFQTELEPDVAATLAATLRGGGMAAIPTESSYALAVSPFHEPALHRLFRTKARDYGKPILVLIGERAQLLRLIEGVPPPADLLMRAFWPGPLTIVFPAHPALPGVLTAESGTIGIRLPDLPRLRRLLEQVGPLTGTSANHAQQPPLCRPEDVTAVLGRDLDCLLDAGETPGGAPSTIIDGRSPLRIIREGAVPRAAIQEVLHRGGIALSP